MHLRYFFKILTIALVISSCSNENDGNYKTKSIGEFQISRFERDLFTMGDEGSPDALYQKYQEFFDIYAKNIIGAGNPRDPALKQYLRSFTNDPTISEVYQKCMEVYPDLNLLERNFGEAFYNYHREFPDKIIPRVISFISGFSYTIVVDDSILSFGLDMYLGKDCEYYPRLGIPQYKFNNMNECNILSDAMKSWISTEYELPDSEEDLLSLMLYHGKLLYALDVLLPDSSDAIKIGYTPEKLKWCVENESEIWFHFIDRELLYEKETALFTKYLSEGPFTAGFPEGSPGEIGKWVGWQIIRKFMENQPELTLKDLFENQTKSQVILAKSNYKPNK